MAWLCSTKAKEDDKVNFKRRSGRVSLCDSSKVVKRKRTWQKKKKKTKQNSEKKKGKAWLNDSHPPRRMFVLLPSFSLSFLSSSLFRPIFDSFVWLRVENWTENNNEQEIDEKLKALDENRKKWCSVTFFERIDLLRQLVENIKATKTEVNTFFFFSFFYLSSFSPSFLFFFFLVVLFPSGSQPQRKPKELKRPKRKSPTWWFVFAFAVFWFKWWNRQRQVTRLFPTFFFRFYFFAFVSHSFSLSPFLLFFFFSSSSSADQAAGRPWALAKPPKATLVDGQYRVDVLPWGIKESLTYNGITGQIWLEPGAKPTQVRNKNQKKKKKGQLTNLFCLDEQGTELKESLESGNVKLSLVMSAGNQSSIGFTDALYKLMTENQVQFFFSFSSVPDEFFPFLSSFSPEWMNERWWYSNTIPSTSGWLPSTRRSCNHWARGTSSIKRSEASKKEPICALMRWWTIST